MVSNVGYKQTQKHFNNKPRFSAEISTLSVLGTTRYNPSLPKTASVQDFLKYPVRYYFDVTVKQPKLATVFQHSYYFDNKNEAEQCHKSLRIKLYDQRTKKYLDKLKKGKMLSNKEQEELLAIMDSVEKLKS